MAGGHSSHHPTPVSLPSEIQAEVDALREEGVRVEFDDSYILVSSDSFTLRYPISTSTSEPSVLPAPSMVWDTGGEDVIAGLLKAMSHGGSLRALWDVIADTTPSLLTPLPSTTSFVILAFHHLIQGKGHAKEAGVVRVLEDAGVGGWIAWGKPGVIAIAGEEVAEDKVESILSGVKKAGKAATVAFRASIPESKSHPRLHQISALSSGSPDIEQLCTTIHSTNSVTITPSQLLKAMHASK